MTESELADWCFEQLKEYCRGNLEEYQIKKMEAIPNWGLGKWYLDFFNAYEFKGKFKLKDKNTVEFLFEEYRKDVKNGEIYGKKKAEKKKAEKKKVKTEKWIIAGEPNFGRKR